MSYDFTQFANGRKGLQMTTHRPLIPALLLALTFSAPVLAQAPKPAAPVLPVPAAANRVATVNGKAIPRTRVESVVKQQTANGAQDSEQLRQAITDQLINMELVAQEVERRGLAKNIDVQTQIEISRQQVLLAIYMQEHFKSRPISDAVLRSEYEKVRAQRGEREYKARHVLVDSEAEAKNVIEQLGKGAKIEDLAKVSKDGGSRDRGGDLGWAAPGTFVKPFADALAKLEKGKFTTQPVQSQFGWHVIFLEDVRNVQFPAFDQVKPQIQRMLQDLEVQKVYAELRAKAKIE